MQGPVQTGLFLFARAWFGNAARAYAAARAASKSLMIHSHPFTLDKDFHGFRIYRRGWQATPPRPGFHERPDAAREPALTSRNGHVRMHLKATIRQRGRPEQVEELPFKSYTRRLWRLSAFPGYLALDAFKEMGRKPDTPTVSGEFPRQDRRTARHVRQNFSS